VEPAAVVVVIYNSATITAIDQRQLFVSNRFWLSRFCDRSLRLFTLLPSSVSKLIAVATSRERPATQYKSCVGSLHTPFQFILTHTLQ
jgi:hypothetical protein